MFDIEGFLDRFEVFITPAALIMVLLVLFCVVGTMDYNDEIGAVKVIEPGCEVHSAEYGREWVEMCNQVRQANSQ
jgi:hypothetical protein